MNCTAFNADAATPDESITARNTILPVSVTTFALMTPDEVKSTTASPAATSKAKHSEMSIHQK